MKKLLYPFVITAALTGSAFSMADSIPAHEYGVYINDDGDYVCLKKFSHLRMDFDYFDELVFCEDCDDEPELIVYNKDVDADDISVAAMSMATPGKAFDVDPEYTRISEDQIKVTFDDDIDPDRILVIRPGGRNDNAYAVALSNPVDAVTEAFSDDNDDLNPVTAEWVLSKMMKVYPDEDDIEDLHEYWADEVMQKKAAEEYKRVSDAWDDYEDAGSPEDKLSALKYANKRVDIYLKTFPDGDDADDVEDLKDEISDKLDL